MSLCVDPDLLPFLSVGDSGRFQTFTMHKKLYYPSVLGTALGGDQVLIDKTFILDLSVITCHARILIPGEEVKELQEKVCCQIFLCEILGFIYIFL